MRIPNLLLDIFQYFSFIKKIKTNNISSKIKLRETHQIYIKFVFYSIHFTLFLGNYFILTLNNIKNEKIQPLTL